MPTRKLFRLSGLSLFIGGILTPLSIIIHPAEESTQAILTQTWRLVSGHVLGTLAIIFVMLGLTGLYVFEAGKAGRLGLIGFVLAFSGNILLATSGNYGYIAPVLAARSPDLLSAINAYPPELGLDLLMVLTYITGFLLLGIATFRAGRLPRWSGPLIAMGPILFFVFSGISLGSGMTWLYGIGVLGQVLFGAGLILCGRQLWNRTKADLEDQVLSPANL